MTAMTVPTFEVIAAVHGRLVGHLTDITGQTVFVTDDPPANETFPYLVLGDISMDDWGTKTSYGVEVMLPMTVWSAFPGTVEVAQILSAAVACVVNGVPLTLTGYNCNTLHPDRMSVERALDDDTQRILRKGTVLLRFLVSQNT